MQLFVQKKNLTLTDKSRVWLHDNFRFQFSSGVDKQEMVVMRSKYLFTGFL